MLNDFLLRRVVGTDRGELGETEFEASRPSRCGCPSSEALPSWPVLGASSQPNHTDRSWCFNRFLFSILLS